MEYMTVQEAAEKWQVSLRLVQRLCVTGRVEGARKFGGAWAIPADTDKPEDLRRTKKEPPAQQEPILSNKSGLILLPLMNTPFRPGQCRATVEAMEGPLRDIAWRNTTIFQATRGGNQSSGAVSHQPEPWIAPVRLPALCLCQSLHPPDPARPRLPWMK